jgi:Oxidoreductase-like protein, N-terminal
MPEKQTLATPQPPELPDDADCCGNGCNPCVFDAYEEAMERYRVVLAQWKAKTG